MQQLSDFEELVIQFAKSLAANSSYTFSQTDMREFISPETGQTYVPEMKACVIMIEAIRYADAFLKYRNKMKPSL